MTWGLISFTVGEQPPRQLARVCMDVFETRGPRVFCWKGEGEVAIRCKRREWAQRAAAIGWRVVDAHVRASDRLSGAWVNDRRDAMRDRDQLRLQWAGSRLRGWLPCLIDRPEH